ncbi:hypothetical protein BJX68DRAFT_255374 [Aspergillus pseudodeflectus]|uniref:Uncharacterized protein n=1 Tax=Aspergillus pseudodeflectus TaxID=176178 RepID=A0ABR4KBJ5_9EURO
MAELDTPMAGLEPGGDVQFKPSAACTVAEIKRYPVCLHGFFPRVEIRSSNCFACAAATTLDVEGSYVSSSETLELAMSHESFTRLSRRYQFSGSLDAWRYRATSGSASRKIEYDEAGAIRSVVFTIAIRLSGSLASIMSIYHSFHDNTSTILALRVSPYDYRLLQQTLETHRNLIGHALLVPTTIIEISLASPAADAPAHGSELSRLGHSAKIYISLSSRRIESVACLLGLIRETSAGGGFGGAGIGGPRDAYRQWVGDLELLLKFRLVDLKYNERRADNQITAIYGILTQRDNIVSTYVAIESKKIAEESKKISESSHRDGSALKSLNVLAVIFLPATFVAALFSLKRFENTPIWVYWVIVVPLTLVIFGSWTWWTEYQQRQIAQETIGRDTDQAVQLDLDRAAMNDSLSSKDITL